MEQRAGGIVFFPVVSDDTCVNGLEQIDRPKQNSHQQRLWDGVQFAQSREKEILSLRRICAHPICPTETGYLPEKPQIISRGSLDDDKEPIAKPVFLLALVEQAGDMQASAKIGKGDAVQRPQNISLVIDLARLTENIAEIGVGYRAFENRIIALKERLHQIDFPRIPLA